MLNTPEAKFVTRLSAKLVALGCDRHNMHGNQFQSGIPDNLVVRPAPLGFTFFEAKHCRAKNPTVATLFNALRPGQRRNLVTWGKRHAAPVYLVADSAHDPSVFYLLDRHDFPEMLKEPTDLPLDQYTLDEVAEIVAFGVQNSQGG